MGSESTAHQSIIKEHKTGAGGRKERSVLREGKELTRGQVFPKTRRKQEDGGKRNRGAGGWVGSQEKLLKEKERGLPWKSWADASEIGPP